MRNPGLLIILVVAVFTSCNQKQNQIPVVGELDSAAIARDTAMQMGFEASYEYHKTITANEKLAYDVVAYGGSASKGELAILQRGADNKADTIGKEPREGMITDATLDAEKKSIHLLLQKPGDTTSKKTLTFDLEKKRFLNP